MNFFKKKKSEKPRNRVSIRVPIEIHGDVIGKDHMALQLMLGKMSNLVSHAVMPFEIDGYLDLYYFEQHIPGVGFSSMELNNEEFDLIPNSFGKYELVAFTKLLTDTNENANSDFNRTEDRLRLIMTEIAKHSTQIIFESEMPVKLTIEDEDVFVILNHYASYQEIEGQSKRYNLMLCMEIFENEFNYTSKNGGDKLLNLLEDRNFYPYSDRNRKSVIK